MTITLNQNPEQLAKALIYRHLEVASWFNQSSMEAVVNTLTEMTNRLKRSI
jgi:hypothetical protein